MELAIRFLVRGLVVSFAAMVGGALEPRFSDEFLTPPGQIEAS